MQKSLYTPQQELLQTLLRQVRHEARLTQVELAERLGKPQSFVSRFESGERILDLPELRTVCQALEIGLVDFVQRYEDMLNLHRNT